MVRTKEQARFVIESFLPLQKQGMKMPCPRCGCDTMHEKVHMNALSRYANVYICESCGTDESLRDFFGQPLPLTEWDCAVRI